MPKETTFKVSKKGQPGVVATWTAPESLEDPRWQEIVKDGNKDIHAAALRSVVISIQSGARNRLNSEAEDNGLSSVQEFVDNFVYGVRQPGAGGGSRKASISADAQKDLKFSKAQRAALIAAGVELPEE